MRRPDPAELVVGSAAAYLLACDVHLHRRRQRLVTDVLRNRGVTLACLYVMAHVIDVLGPADIFRFVGRFIPQVAVDAVDAVAQALHEGDTPHVI